MTNEVDTVIDLIDQALAAALLHEDQALYQQDVQQSLAAVGLSLEDAYPFSELVPILFEHLPKASNGFRFAKNITFDRNQDCICGSGKKFKKCCSELMSLSSLNSEELFYAALNKMDQGALLRLANKQNWTKHAMTALFDVAMEREYFDVVVKLAPVIIEQINKLKNSDDEIVASLLDALFEEQQDGLRLNLIHQLTELKQAKSLRSLGYQRLAMIEAQNGNEALARDCIQQAIQCDAKQPELPMCELTVLGVIGSEQELKARAKFWLAFSRKRWGDDHPVVDFINEILVEGKALFDVAHDAHDAHDEVSIASCETAALLVDVLRVKKWPFIYQLENSELGTGLHLPSSLVKQKLDFMDAFNQQLEMVKKADGEKFQYDEYIAHSWHWPDLKWVTHLQQAPELLADFDVLETLMPFMYQAPETIEDYDAQPEDLTPLGLVSPLFQLCCHHALKNTLDHLPKTTHLPIFIDVNKGFWDVAFEVYMQNKESGQESIFKDLHKQLMSLAKHPPTWLENNDVVAH